MKSAEIVSGELRLVLNNCLAAIQDGQARMAPFLSELALSAKSRNRVDVIFEELIANIVRHGFTPHSAQSIHVAVRKAANGVELVFEDDGLAFNPLEAEMPEQFVSLDQARIGGQGIALVKKMSAAVRYEQPEPEGDGRFLPRNRLVVQVA